MTISFPYTADRYKNFAVAVYCTVYDVQKMADLAWLEQRFDVIPQNRGAANSIVPPHAFLGRK